MNSFAKLLLLAKVTMLLMSKVIFCQNIDEAELIFVSEDNEELLNELDGETDDDGGNMSTALNTTLCSNSMSAEDDRISQVCKFWIQGVSLTLIGICGIIGNTISVFVLTRPSMLSTFNQILAVMTTMDTLYLISSIIEYSFVESFNFSSLAYDKFFVYFIYPIHNVTLVCSIFLHVILAFERYLAVCHPELVYSNQRRANKSGNNPGLNSQNARAVRKKVLIYIVPVMLCSFIINLPKWFELELRDMVVNKDGSLEPFYDSDVSNTTALDEEVEEDLQVVTLVAGTWLRYNNYYVNYYMHWTLFLTTGILPLAALFFLNLRIYLRLKAVRQIRTQMSRNEPNYAATLASIIVIFIVCHMPRLLKTVYEIVFTNLLKASGTSCSGVINPAKCLAHFNNFILVINASSGFFVYCFIGTFGVKFVEVLTSRCRRRQPGNNRTSSSPNNVQLQEFNPDKSPGIVKKANNDGKRMETNGEKATLVVVSVEECELVNNSPSFTHSAKLNEGDSTVPREEDEEEELDEEASEKTFCCCASNCDETNCCNCSQTSANDIAVLLNNTHGFCARVHHQGASNGGIRFATYLETDV